ncbi:hypothetical protein ACHAXR_010216 [Thalassiosira sp. AJA248-18]
MRYGAKDFNYTFVSTTDEEDHNGVDDAIQIAEVDSKQPSDTTDDPFHRSSRAGDESINKPYVFSTSSKFAKGGSNNKQPRKQQQTAIIKMLGEEDDDAHHLYGDGGEGGGGSAVALSGMGACCCCIAALCVVAGGVLLAYEQFISAEEGVGEEGGGVSNTNSNNNGLVLAGVIVLILAAGAFLLGCCSCCFSFLASCGGGGGGGGGGGLLDGAFGVHHDDDDPHDIKIKLQRLNDQYDKAESAINSIHLDVLGDMKEVKEAKKKEDNARKEGEKLKRKELEERVRKDLEKGLITSNMRRNYRPIAFLVQFHGDMMVSNMELLKKQVSIIVNCGRAGVDRAVVVVTSPGGAVSPYGLAASQLARIRKAGIQLIVCVDTVAASGGYMMASVGDTICAAPFAIIGSIGVVTQIPNVQRFLNKHDIDAFLFTAGKHKRTVDIIGDVTDEGKAKLQEELDDMHRAFKDHVALARPALKDKIEDIGTGEYWMAVQAKTLGLVDEIMTSDEYLESISNENEIIEIMEKKRKKGALSALHGSAKLMQGVIEGMSSPSHRSWYNELVC